jgi:hypothetical protein
MRVLRPEQKYEYDRQGFALIPGLIPIDVLESASSRLQAMVDRAEVSSGHGAFDEPVLVACYGAGLLTAAAELAGEPEALFPAPQRAYIINSLPSEGPWQWPQPHIDHAIKEHGHRTFPRAFRIASMTFLSDVEPQGGGTVVWPGSHLKLRALAESDQVKYEFMWALNQDLALADIGSPVELTPKRGDVLFYHYLCAHAGSKNAREEPRLAMNCKW